MGKLVSVEPTGGFQQLLIKYKPMIGKEKTFLGSVTVWYDVNKKKRPNTEMESFLSKVWEKFAKKKFGSTSFGDVNKTREINRKYGIK